jgi:hypothetical protein
MMSGASSKRKKDSFDNFIYCMKYKISIAAYIRSFLGIGAWFSL